MITAMTKPQKNNFLDKVNLLVYPVEGQHTKGYCIPHVTDWGFMLEVRIKESVAPQFLKDIEVKLPEFEGKDTNIGKHTGGMIFLGLGLLRRLMGLEKPKVASEKMYDFFGPSWQYIFVIGVKRDEYIEGVEVL